MTRSATVRLMLSYLAIIIALSVGFSIAFYETSIASLYAGQTQFVAHGKPRSVSKFTAPTSTNHADPNASNLTTAQLDGRLQAIRSSLRSRLIALNVGVALIGVLLSYYLARRTLRPVEAALEAQSRFASDASHEFRTPLAIMQTENEEGLDVADLPKRARKLIRSNLEEIGRLKDLSDGLLQLSRSETLPLQPVWADDISNEAINQVVKSAQASRIAIEDLWPHVQLSAHPHTLTQLVIILLDNAIKYSSAGSTIHLEGTQTAKQVRLQVRDEGVGIRSADLPHIFERFYRGNRATTPGHGLGLSIAQKLAAQQRATLTVESRHGHGTTFTITLPVAK